MNSSRQRDLITDILSNTKTHPTAEWVLAQARLVMPNLSLATVYRNLKQLVIRNESQIILVGDNSEHYDKDTSCHGHMYCKTCGAVADIELSSKEVEFIGAIFNNDFQLLYNGECAECIKNNLEEN